MPNDPILKLIADNPTLLQALKDVLLEQFNELDIMIEMTDENIGQITRSKLIGVQKVEQAFKEISKYKTPEPRVERLNRAI